MSAHFLGAVGKAVARAALRRIWPGRGRDQSRHGFSRL